MQIYLVIYHNSNNNNLKKKNKLINIFYKIRE